MKLVKNRYFQLLIAFFALGAVFFAKPVFALEPNYELPSMLWGRASVTTKPGTSESMVYFSQPQATMAIRNTAPGFLLNFDYSVDCLLGITDTNISCFKFSQPSGTKVLNSKTYVNRVLKSAVAALKYPPVNVTGSTYSASDLGDFAYWGRHLRQTGDNYSRNAFWQATDYQFNLAAQAYWNSGNNLAMNTTIARLLQNTKPLPTSLMTGSFYGICGQVINCDDENQYPDGRVWLSESSVQVGNDSFPQLSYDKKSTIIIGDGVNQSDLTIDASILPILNADQVSSIGFIVRKGNVTITNSSGTEKTIKAAIFAPNGMITIGTQKVPVSNITLVGSFVANNFDVSGTNINFVQDTRGENAWPPGFRELQLPIILNK